MHGAIQDHRRGHAFQPERADEGRGLPMAVRNRCPTAFTTQSSAIAPSHLGRGSGLIDEHQPFGLKIDLGIEPSLPSVENVRPLLFARIEPWGVCGFF